MRIAFVSHCRRKIGGAEVYLDSVVPAFAQTGHDVSWLYETNAASDREPVSCPDRVPSLCISDMGLTDSLRALRDWNPDVIYNHGLSDPATEAALMDVAPTVLYLHNYYGTCISGNKLHSSARSAICKRNFGAACLLHYFPDHCGGRSPLTMWSQYRVQARRFELMRRYKALIANSEHIKKELARHDLQSDCVYPFTTPGSVTGSMSPAIEEDPLRLIFAGRMTSLKGGDYLLAALPKVQRCLARKIHTTFAGDGPQRPEWQRIAAGLQSENLSFHFPGWLSTADLQASISASHLLVFPSMWPEPFGLSGLEAGFLAVPTAAFPVGGIPEWLKDGVNGHLATTPADADSLAEAIAKCLCDRVHYEQLRVGACREAHKYPLDQHIGQLTRIFERCVEGRSL